MIDVYAYMDAEQIVVLEESDVPGNKLDKPANECSIIKSKRWVECQEEKNNVKKRKLLKRMEGCLLINRKVDPKIDGVTKKAQEGHALLYK